MSTQNKTIIVDGSCKLGYSNNTIIISKESQQEEYTLENIRCLIISDLRVSLSTYLLNELQKRNITVIFCDEKKLPSCELVSFTYKSIGPGKLFEQIKYNSYDKILVWTDIIKSKINNQYKLLEKYRLSAAEDIKKLLLQVEIGDPHNIEARAAKISFKSLFGKDFVRFNDDDINRGLDYGYAILKSEITRALIIHGYHPSFGLKHRNKQNSYNLTYDLIEFFRVHVDEIIYHKQGDKFDTKYKKDLIERLSNKNVRYNNKNFILFDLIDYYVLQQMGRLRCHELEKE